MQSFFCMPEPLRCMGPLFWFAQMALNRAINALPLLGITNPRTVEA